MDDVVRVRRAVEPLTTMEDYTMNGKRETVQALIIPVDDAQPIRLESLAPDASVFQSAIGGGWLEGVTLREPRATLYCDEEGKLKGLAVNRIATMLAWKHGHSTGDELVGDCLIVGPPTSGGHDTDVPAAYVDALTGGQQ